MADQTVPLCVDCEHFANFDLGCTRPLRMVFSPVDGRHAERLLRDAAGERAGDKTLFTRRMKCGPVGRFFEARHPLPPPPLAKNR